MRHPLYPEHPPTQKFTHPTGQWNAPVLPTPLRSGVLAGGLERLRLAGSVTQPNHQIVFPYLTHARQPQP